MHQIPQATPKNDFLREDVYPTIYSTYPVLLKETYDETQNQTEISKELNRNYRVKNKPTGKQYVETDYITVQVQNVYLMRYFFPHSLLVPFVLDSLSRRITYHFPFHIISELFKRESLTTSFFGGGPCPEFYGLTCYLNKTPYSPINISSAVFDKTKWKFRCGNGSSPFFQTDLAGGMGSFLSLTSEEWVRKSDLIVIQNCLNEIEGFGSNYNPQLLRNMTHIVNLMKPGALMLVIERYGYALVMNFLTDFRSHLNRLNNVQTYYRHYEKLEFEDLNDNIDIPGDIIDIPGDIIERLHNNWLWMSNSLQFHWLAISKNS